MGVEIADRAWMRERLLHILPAYLRAMTSAKVADVRIDALERPHGGQSNETVILAASWRTGSKPQTARLVLRLQPRAHQMFLDADVLAEAGLLREIRRVSTVPVPEVLVVEEDDRALGRPFFIMSFVAGHVPGGRPSIHRDPWLAAATPPQRRLAVANAMKLLAMVHAVDWRAMSAFPAGPGGLAEAIHHVQEWYGWAARDRSFPLIEAAIDRLGSSRLELSGSDVLLWGDPRPGNIVYADDYSVAAALDWEMASVGPPEADLGWWLMMDEFARIGAEGDVLDGFPSKARTVQIYEQASGHPLQDLAYFELLASVRLAITLIPAADSLASRGLIAASSRFAHDNVPAQMIARLLGVDPPEICGDYRRLSRMKPTPQPATEQRET
jgi:aminoglycoside phosphotransferase (APT) family kinase protein